MMVMTMTKYAKTMTMMMVIKSDFIISMMMINHFYRSDIPV